MSRGKSRLAFSPCASRKPDRGSSWLCMHSLPSCMDGFRSPLRWWPLAVESASLLLPLLSGFSFYSENPYVSSALIARNWKQLHSLPTSREAELPNLVWMVRTLHISCDKCGLQVAQIPTKACWGCMVMRCGGNVEKE